MGEFSNEEKTMEPIKTNFEQMLTTTFKVKHEDREYTLTFPGDAHLQELWDFLQAVGTKIVEASKKNEEAMKAATNSETTGDSHGSKE